MLSCLSVCHAALNYSLPFLRELSITFSELEYVFVKISSISYKLLLLFALFYFHPVISKEGRGGIAGEA